MDVNQIKDHRVMVDIEPLSNEEAHYIQGGEVIFGETILYWAVYYAGRVVKGLSDAVEKRPNDPYTYSQTYKMGTF